MPVLTVARDPVLISIDRQRLADLGIPSIAVHEFAASFYGAFGIMWSALVVPEGWQNALPDEIVEEWDEAEWSRAGQDASNEKAVHHSKVDWSIPVILCVLATFLTWLVTQCVPVLIRIHELSDQGSLTSGQLATIVPNLQAIGPFLAIGGITGLLAFLATRILSHSFGVWCVAFALFLFYDVLPVLGLVYMIIGHGRL